MRRRIRHAPARPALAPGAPASGPRASGASALAAPDSDAPDAAAQTLAAQTQTAQTLAAPDARAKLLDAAMRLIRERGFTGVSVDDLCRAAGVTKGAFFHHFQSKEMLGAAAARHWSITTGALFASAAYHRPKDPLRRVLAYIDFRASLIEGGAADFSCLAGTMIQEMFSVSEPIRAACGAAICDHADTLVSDIAAAKHLHGVRGRWTPASLALHMQAVLQGAFIMAKATGRAETAIESVAHLRRYVELLFAETERKRR